MKTILTHKQPDLDAVVSTWLAQKYLFGGEQTTVLFVARSTSRAQMEAADCVVDVGNAYDPERLWFDHKPLLLRIVMRIARQNWCGNICCD